MELNRDMYLRIFFRARKGSRVGLHLFFQKDTAVLAHTRFAGVRNS